ncbi:serine/threonine-protein kinase [Dictyobacter kobayashii]|uniref:non-specific serine/threonine protein kinase n=1 Tax=Dictyobacter kobayashii TaxID=2014872 RepID=A0A402AAW0_9CHLR|nr:serine/threonine-protein kinase [Dictyobacter kobayashii]GCE16304.1 hypothetical protein KDK_01040 [Dictyobacter kobayashii]
MVLHSAITGPGKMLGRYRLLALLGRGGMGEVWRAEDTELHRHVAVKLLPPVLANEQEYLKAFADEARMAGGLEHPNILPVHDFGEMIRDDEVLTYLIMQLVEGGSLRDRLVRAGQQLLPVEESLNYLRQAALAIDYAHSKHILHRDIKPANMLLQENWLFLTDFGISKLLSTNTYRSRTNAGAGTPQYMAPEQIQKKAEPASDLYSLAITAYQLLTGHFPFQHADAFEILLMHIQKDPPAPRQFNPNLPESMERTLLQGIAKRPEDRPSSCQTFVSELEQGWRHSNLSRMLPAGVDPEATLLAPWSKRKIASQPTQPGATRLGAMTTLTPASNVSPTQIGERTPSSDTQEGQVTAPEKPAGTVKRRAFLIGGIAALALVLEGSYILSNVLNKQEKVTGPKELIAGQPLFKLMGHTEPVKNVRWSPKEYYLVTGGDDARILLWNIDTLKSKAATQSITVPGVDWAFGEWRGNDFPPNHLDWSPDGQQLAVLSVPTGTEIDPEIALIDVFTANAKPDFPKSEINKATPIDNSQLSWSPTDKTMATLYTNVNLEGTFIGVWQVDDKNVSLQTSWKVPDSQVGFNPVALGWTNDGSHVISLNAGSGITLQFNVFAWVVRDGKNAEPQVISLPDRARYLPGTKDPLQVNVPIPSIKGAPHTPDQFVTTNLDSVVIYDLQQKKILYQLGTDDPAAHKTVILDVAVGTHVYPQMGALAWSPNGRYVAGSYISSPQIYVWDLQDPHPKQTKTGLQQPTLSFGKTGGHRGTIYDLSWSADGRYLTSASNDKTAIVWKVDGAA